MIDRVGYKSKHARWQVFGEPHVMVGSFLQLWIHDRVFIKPPPSNPEYGDGHWVLVTAAAYFPESEIEVPRLVVHLSAFARYLRACRQLLEAGLRSVEFDAIQPLWLVTINADAAGAFSAETLIKPDASAQTQRFTEVLDRTALETQTEYCEAMLERFSFHGG